MCGQAVENVDEAKDRGGQARYKDDIELKDPRATDDGGDEGENVAGDEENDGDDSRGFRADRERRILLESGGKYEEAGDGQPLGSTSDVKRQEQTQSLSRTPTE